MNTTLGPGGPEASRSLPGGSATTAGSPIPQGPGVTAPFPAPPAEGGGTRLGWALAIAGLFVVLCCGGGGAALIGFVVTQVAATNEQAQAVVSSYLDSLREEDYARAYELLCDNEQQALTKDRFERRERARRQIDDYNIGEADINTLRVPVTEHYQDGSSERVIYLLEPDQKTAQLEICGRD